MGSCISSENKERERFESFSSTETVATLVADPEEARRKSELEVKQQNQQLHKSEIALFDTSIQKNLTLIEIKEHDIKEVETVPELVYGKMEKLAGGTKAKTGIFASKFQERVFVLEKGILKYYQHELFGENKADKKLPYDCPVYPYGKSIKGVISLNGYRVYADINSEDNSISMEATDIHLHFDQNRYELGCVMRIVMFMFRAISLHCCCHILLLLVH